jgi:hypothetical protein
MAMSWAALNLFKYFLKGCTSVYATITPRMNAICRTELNDFHREPLAERRLLTMSILERSWDCVAIFFIASHQVRTRHYVIRHSTACRAH